MNETADPFNRPPITDPIRQKIRDAFAIVPEGKTGAVLAIADLDTGEARLHAAWKVGDKWTVGAQLGWAKGKKPSGYVGVEFVW
jgi:hypothetical protein